MLVVSSDNKSTVHIYKLFREKAAEAKTEADSSWSGYVEVFSYVCDGCESVAT